MELVKRPLLVCLASGILLGIIGILAWGVGFISQSAWARFEKDENLVETIRASRVAYAKPLKVAWGVRNSTLESNNATESKKWMQYPSITISKSFMGGIFPYLYIHFKTLFASSHWNAICFFVLGFGAQQRKLLLQMQFDLCLNIVNYLLITMYPKF